MGGKTGICPPWKFLCFSSVYSFCNATLFHSGYVIKPPQPSSAIYGAPPFTGHPCRDRLRNPGANCSTIGLCCARWCFWFSANDSSIEQVCPPLVYTMCEEAWVKKKHCCQQSAFSATNAPLKVLKWAEPPDHLRSEISSCALATFQNIGKARKQEAIWIKGAVCSYIHKILHHSKNSQSL